MRCAVLQHRTEHRPAADLRRCKPRLHRVDRAEAITAGDGDLGPLLVPSPSWSVSDRRICTRSPSGASSAQSRLPASVSGQRRSIAVSMSGSWPTSLWCPQGRHLIAMKASSGRAPAPAVAATASQSWLLNPLAGSRRENIESLMADDIETVRRVGLQRAYALIRGLEACRA